MTPDFPCRISPDTGFPCEQALNDHFPVAEDFTMRKGVAASNKPTVLSLCPTCGKRTCSTGVSRKLREPDGRVYLEMECGVCCTSTKVYFTEGTNEFQENLDAPDDAEA